jgi:alpha-glucosidase
MTFVIGSETAKRSSMLSNHMEPQNSQIDLGNVTEVNPGENIFEFLCNNGKLKVSVLGPKIIRVQATRTNDYRLYDSFARIPYYDEVQSSLEESGDKWIIASEFFKLEVKKKLISVCLFDRQGASIIDLPAQVGIEWAGESFVCRMRMVGEAHFYGLGEKAHGLDKRGLRYEMWNTDNPDHDSTSDPLYQTVPFFIVLQEGIAYGVFLDNSYRTSFDFGHDDETIYQFGAPDGPLDFYIILGPKITDVIDGYTSLTGKPHFTPRWALGHQHSRWELYEHEDDILNVAKGLREHQIPCDTMVLDIAYMDEFRVFTWDNKIFPNPKDFTKKLGELSFKVMAIIDPGVKLDENYSLYKEGLEKGYFIKKSDGSPYVGLVWPGETVFPDFSRAKVREWFGSQYTNLAEVGLSNSSWIDMNEPSNCIYPGMHEEYPISEAVDSDGNPWEPRLRNVYALGMTEAVFEGLKKAYPNQRPFILTRSGFSGYQRYAAMWTGDNHSHWEYLKLSIPMLLGLGLSGIPICGADIGGFSDDVTGELLARWYQLGAFYPFSRNHSRLYTARQEPWLFGEKVEKIARKYLSLRYQLLRYLYSLAWESSTKGIPVMRPLVLGFQSDSGTHSLDTQFMIGPFIMIAPILEEKAESREVYFPEGIWYDFWTGNRIKGRQKQRVLASLDIMPIYIKAGALIPAGRIIQHTNEEQGTLFLWIYPGANSKFILYEDDGISENGPFALTHFKLDCNGKHITLNLEERVGEWAPPDRLLTTEIYSIENKPKCVKLDGIEPIAEYDVSCKLVRITINDDGRAHEIQISL